MTPAKKARISRSGRLKPLFDTIAIVQNTSEYKLFPANASKSNTENNYVSNPLPGSYVRKVLAISIESNLQTIRTATGVDPVKIINALKKASLIITVDSDRKQMLHMPIEEFLNFSGSDVHAAYSGTGAATVEYANLKSWGAKQVPDPFQIGVNQSFEVKIEFADSSNFPTAAQWTTADFGALELKVKIYVSEEKAA